MADPRASLNGVPISRPATPRPGTRDGAGRVAVPPPSLRPAPAPGPADGGRLVVVSNRVAAPRQGLAGGLATAMHAALKQCGGLWFGWSGTNSDDSAGRVHTTRADGIQYSTVDLGSADFQAYYNGFANRTLWPLFHYRLDLVDYQRDHYDGYLRVNRLFAGRLARLLRPGDVVWVHDYHLIPLALVLRRLGVTNRIGFFLHTPLPGEDLLTSLPRHRELFEALAAYDLVGFQTDAHLGAFLDYCRHEMGAVVSADGHVVACGRHFRAGAFPIGIQVDDIGRAARRAEHSPPLQRLRASLGDRKLVIGVDRLDYSKGIPERFTAFERYLEEHPDQHGRVTLLQITPRSRDKVAEYRQMRARLNRQCGAINGALATPDWVPIHYLNRSFQHGTLAGYYRLADVGLVTPLRDGMNLVAKEYVAAQDPEDPGVLVLSRFAGAARELREAIIINPYDPQEVAEGIARALAMPLAERRQRWQALHATICGNDIDHWRDGFLAALAGSAAGQAAQRVPAATAGH